MATALRLRRGTTTQHGSFTGLEGEVTVDTTKDTVVVHDGSTAGGFPLARDSAVVHNTGTETVAGVKTFGDGIATDTISEETAAAGVTIDSVVLKDGGATLTAPVILADGTASAPSVTNTGDTNTGVYFPAADEVAVAAGGSVAAAFNSHQFMGMRNRIINGDMRIDQRNAGATTTGNVYTLDRWENFSDVGSTYTIQQVADAPTGFINSLKLSVTTGNAVAAGEQAVISQKIEGFNVSDLYWGSASAKTVTLSFWVKASATGTYTGNVQNAAPNRALVFTYSVSVADTWEYKTVSIAGDTSGTWGTGNGTGIGVFFNLGSGSNFQGTANTWGSSINRTVSGAVQPHGTTGATWQVTGVQLEVGSVATPFERRPYGTELALCQRYYTKSYNVDVAPGTNTSDGSFAFYATAVSGETSGSTRFPVTMRATPTVTFYTPAGTSGAIRNVSDSTNDTGAAANSAGQNGWSYIGGSRTANKIYQYHYIASIEL